MTILPNSGEGRTGIRSIVEIDKAMPGFVDS
jgi:hypothetical protein